MRERQNTAMSTELSLSGTCGDRVSLNHFRIYCRNLTGSNRKNTYVGHVTDSNELAGSCQVEAVHFVLHTASYFTVTAAEVSDHYRGRSEIKDAINIPANTANKLASSSPHKLLM